jgi:hypothetical protein
VLSQSQIWRGGALSGDVDFVVVVRDLEVASTRFDATSQLRLAPHMRGKG